MVSIEHLQRWRAQQRGPGTLGKMSGMCCSGHLLYKSKVYRTLSEEDRFGEGFVSISEKNNQLAIISTIVHFAQNCTNVLKNVLELRIVRMY
jgi:hypothetical protein